MARGYAWCLVALPYTYDTRRLDERQDMSIRVHAGLQRESPIRCQDQLAGMVMAVSACVETVGVVDRLLWGMLREKAAASREEDLPAALYFPHSFQKEVVACLMLLQK